MNASSQYRTLIVCTGNICRSPVAEAMLTSLAADLSDAVFFSAGLAAPIGVAPHRFAIESARDLGYFLDPNKVSKSICLADVNAANLILVMERRQRAEITQRYSGALAKTFLMGQWQGRDIPDPIGEDRAFFDVIALKLESAAKAWAVRLKSLRS